MVAERSVNTRRRTSSMAAAAKQHAISADNAGDLATKWTFETHGDVSATPAVVGGAVYFPDWGGYINKVNAATGALIWQRKLTDYGYNTTADLPAAPLAP